MSTRAILVLLLLLLFLATVAGGMPAAQAEPYIAVQQGYKCVICHVNPSGGGMRNEFGDIFAQSVMPAHTIDVGESTWTGQVNRFIGFGGNLRADWTETEVRNQPSNNEFEVSDGRIYLLAQPVPGRVAVYVDERVAPGSATNMEAYARYMSEDTRWFVQAGRMYLPFGLRLEDDSAFTRRVPGINMNTPDEGIEAGWESANWSAQLAVSNGSGGGPETNTGKQLTGLVAYVDSRWRLGGGASYNSSDAGDRSAYSLFGGLKTGPVGWLGEVAIVEDQGFTEGTRTLATALLEADWSVMKGNNLKLTAEWFDPDRDVANDQQTRWSAIYEYTPIQFLQLRGGARISDGIPQNDLQHTRIYFVELHGFF